MYPLTILLVDDDEDDKELFCEAIAEIDSSINCLKANTGLEALELLKELDPYPSFIFLDLNMPYLNGFQCLQRLKSCKTTVNIPVVIYTTSKLEDDITEAKRLGACYFLTKPTNFPELKEELIKIFAFARG
jgi:CheY-like chemotaxis protein